MYFKQQNAFIVIFEPQENLMKFGGCSATDILVAETLNF